MASESTISAIKPRVFNFVPKPWQDKAHRIWLKSRGIVVTGGIYTGKTAWAAFEVFSRLVATMRGSRWWWVAGLNWQIDAMWDNFESCAKLAGARTKSMPYRRAEFAGGGIIECVTAKNVGLLRSKHVDGVVIDEAGYLAKGAWDRMYGRLVGTKKTLIMGSAEYNVDFQRYITMARNKKAGYNLVDISTVNAGLLTKKQIEQAREELPESVFKRDILGIQPSSGEGVFRKIVEAQIRPGPLRAGIGLVYLITYDPAKRDDIAAVCIWRGKKLIRAVNFEHTDYTIQAQTVAALAREYNCAMVIMDAQGPGEAVYELLTGESDKGVHFDVYPIRGSEWNNATKATLVNRVALWFERGEIQLIKPEAGPEYVEMNDELCNYDRIRLPSGISWAYEAREGHKDDMVTCVLLMAMMEGGYGVTTLERARDVR